MLSKIVTGFNKYKSIKLSRANSPFPSRHPNCGAVMPQPLPTCRTVSTVVPVRQVDTLRLPPSGVPGGRSIRRKALGAELRL